MISCKRCFNCNHNLPVFLFANNNVKFKLKTSKGKLFHCRICTLIKSIKNNQAIRKINGKFQVVKLSRLDILKELFKR